MIYKSFLISVLLSVLSQPAHPVSVVIKSTHFEGSIKEIDGKQVNSFLGIPYAQPPVGDLRFKKPLPVVDQKERVDGTEWKAACYQNELFKEIIINKKVSEDCLYLNIWSPKNVSKPDTEENKLRPVLFWIHGGAYISDSASRDVYNGEILAAKSDVVVVSINYRLDIFGFLYSGTDEAPGNVGLWDQALALEWVVDNIAYFGGDSKKITIIGENAGAFSVGVHLLSPITRNLYQNAVMISGSALNYIIGENPEVAKDKWAKAAKEADCGNGKELTDKVMACLRKTGANKLSKTLLKISQSVKTQNKKADEITPQVVFGDSFLPEEPLTMLANGDHKHNVNVFIGHTDDEGGYMLPMVDMKKYSLTDPKDMSKSEAMDEIKKLTKQLISEKKIDGEKVAKTYISPLSSSDPAMIRRTLGVALGDFYITCPTIIFAKMLFKSDPKKIKVYHYYWSRKVGEAAMPCAAWMGACHATDTYMLFGDAFQSNDSYTDDERNASLNFIQTIAYFATNGRPLSQEGKQWPSYYMKDEEVIAPYYEFSGKNIEKKRVYAKNLKTKECEKLWKKYIV